jgi:molybdenum cofactor cytidylyltransferase
MPGMVSGVVLAAGASSRMGTHKLLLPLGGVPLVRRVASAVLDAGFDDVLVVVGYEHERVIEGLAGLPVRHAVNPEYASGMGSSFRTAVAALPESEAAMFALADQPLLTAADYRRVLDAYLAGLKPRPASLPQGPGSARPGDPAASPSRDPASAGSWPGIVCVRYGEVTAPPHLFDRRYFAELSRLEHGARPVLQRHADDTVVLQFAPELLLDIDTPADYERARAMIE